MSLATVSGANPSLPELVDGVAARTGAWVVVERLGAVIAHGAGAGACPAPLVEALLSKRTGPLRSAVTWSRGGRHLDGSIGGTPLTAVELGDGVTAWFLGAPVDEAVLPVLAAASRGEEQPVVDPFVQELLHPRGPARRGTAPAALLVVLRHAGSPAALSRRVAAAVAGTAARVHTEAEAVVVALQPDGDPAELQRLVATSVPDVVAGAVRVEQDASDWTSAAAVAAAAAAVATSLGLCVGRPEDPLVAAELVVAEAQAAVGDLVRSLPADPLRRLREHDSRSSGELVASLTAWCRAAGDVPRAAAALHVHPNTLRYRLKRATEVCGLDLSRPRQLLALQLLLEV